MAGPGPGPEQAADDENSLMAGVIDARGLVKKYEVGDDVVVALDSVDCAIEEGEMVAITGSSGSGKSTLMHILGCLDKTDSGSYSLGGEDVSRMSGDRLAEVRNRRIGFIFQTFNLLPRLSALENVELPLLYAGRTDARERAREALSVVGLSERMRHEPNQLSGGQRQRVAVARALVTNPDILLADEPTGNLDSKTGEEVLNLFRDLNDKGHTIVIVTHDPGVASHCARQVKLKDGRIIESGVATATERGREKRLRDELDQAGRRTAMAVLLKSILKVGVKSLIANKMRSFLAMLGIVIGVGAVIAMLALGAGAQKQVMDRFAALGTNLLVITPAQRGFGGVITGSQQTMKVEDANAIVREIEGVNLVAPGVSTSTQVKYYQKNTRTTVFGTSESYFPIRDLQTESGRFFTGAEVERTQRVAVVGPNVVRDTFGGNDPIDEIIKINGISFRVIGVTKAKGEGFGSPDDRIFIPYTTAMTQVIGVNYLREIDVKIKDDYDLAQVQENVRQLLRTRHRVQANQDDDVQITNMDEIRKNASDVTDIFKWLLGGIAAISLLVGGIGIMNIMLVTVTERTREIGVRKAIGAKENHILLQFLIESVIVSGMGGLLGLGLGIGLAQLVPKFGPFQAVIEAQSIILSISVAAGVGIFFGLYPAWKAAKLDPIEALRHE